MEDDDHREVDDPSQTPIASENIPGSWINFFFLTGAQKLWLMLCLKIEGRVALLKACL
jgi:hypothetical protein